MATFPISVRIAQAIGLTGAAWLSALSLISIPALSVSEQQDIIPASTLSRQWHSIFLTGKAQNPPVAAVAAGSFAYLAWSVHHSHMARLYGTAALLTIGIVPWTILAMNETNRKLTAKAQEKVGMKGSGVRDEDVHGLLRKWTTLNGIRSVLPLLGSVVAMVAVLA